MAVEGRKDVISKWVVAFKSGDNIFCFSILPALKDVISTFGAEQLFKNFQINNE